MRSTEIPKAIEDALEACHGTTSRRDFLKSSGVFVLSFSGARVANTGRSGSGAGSQAPVTQPAAPYPDPDFRLLDSWLAVHEDDTATFYVGKTDGGQGTGTAFRQMMCDELDIAFEKATLVMGRTDMTVDLLYILSLCHHKYMTYSYLYMSSLLVRLVSIVYKPV